MREEYTYLKDEELEALIEEIENTEMLSPPVYLKSQIMSEIQKVHPMAEKSQPIEEKVRPIAEKAQTNEAKRQLAIYSLKILAAAAMALFCLTAVPVELSGASALSREERIERMIDKDMERYEKESKKLLDEQKEDKTDLKEIIGSKSEKLFHIWSDFIN